MIFSILKHVESANTIFSCVWGVVGAYWVTAASPDLMQNPPELYWVCISFLASDIVFFVLCMAITCLLGIAVCCFLPCIIAILYAMADQEGATQEEIEQLRKFKSEGNAASVSVPKNTKPSCGKFPLCKFNILKPRGREEV